jgi:hypothetical protein
MATTNGNRKLLDLKRWEMVTPCPVASTTGALIAPARMVQQQQMLIQSATAVYLYNPFEDGWVQAPSPALAGTFGAGACAVNTCVGPTGTATAGTTTTITTGLTLARGLAGYQVMITAGPGAGDVRTIQQATVGASSIITVTSAFSTAITSASVFRLMTPRWYVLNAVTASGTTTSAVFRYYDFALNTWTTLAANAPAAVIGTDSSLVATPSYIDNTFVSFATGTVASATNVTNATVTVTGKTWTVNSWSNYQFRVTAGTGIGQIKSITSNTGNVLTLNGVFTTALDATSVYTIEANDDYIYYMGTNAVTLYRYSISGAAWATLTPGTARAAAPTTGMSGNWVWAVTDASWTNESAIKNGRFIYSARGGAGAIIDTYDIALNTWANAITYAPATETFTTGSKATYFGNYIYFTKEATGRWFQFDVLNNSMEGWDTMLYTQGTAVIGNTAFAVPYVDGATTIPYTYMLLNTSTVMLRQMVI